MTIFEFTCPHCRSVIEVPLVQAGATLPCPACKEWVTTPDAEELAGDPTQPAPAHRPEAVPPPGPTRSSALGGGWSCLVTGALLMYTLPGAHLLYLPLFGVAFILGIVAMAQGRAMGGQLVLVLSLVVPAVVGVRFLGMDLPEWAQIPGLTSPRTVPGDAGSGADLSPSTLSEASTAPTAPATPPATVPAPTGDRDGILITPLSAPTTPVRNDPSPTPSTDWDARYQYWFDQCADRFTPPTSGSEVTLTLLSGSTTEGTVLSVGESEIVLKIPKGSINVSRDILADSTRRRFFREDFARYYAQRQVQLERERERAAATPPTSDRAPPSPPEPPARRFDDFF